MFSPPIVNNRTQNKLLGCALLEDTSPAQNALVRFLAVFQ